MAPEDGRREVAAAGPRTCLGSDNHGHGPPVLPLAATEHGVLQLAHLAGTIVGHEELDRLGGSPDEHRADSVAVASDRNLHERVRFYMDAPHGNPALGPAPEPADRVGVAPEHPRRRGATA